MVFGIPSLRKIKMSQSSQVKVDGMVFVRGGLKGATLDSDTAQPYIVICALTMLSLCSMFRVILSDLGE